jgi:hypothetical protein
MLVCPLSKTRLTLSADRTELISVAAHLAFPIKMGVPMLSLDEAREMTEDEMKAFTEFLDEQGATVECIGATAALTQVAFRIIRRPSPSPAE